MASLTFGALSLVLPLSSTFFAFAGVGVVGAMVARRVARRQKEIEHADMAELGRGGSGSEGRE